MIQRQLCSVVTTLRRGYPAIAISGPRHSGKTTLAKQACGTSLPYVNFESPLERAEFTRDPLGFFQRFPKGGILDEVQHIPNLNSFLQVQIDQEPAMGRWILTGSQHLELERGLTQSLAGRVAMLELLPLSYQETRAAGRHPPTLAAAVLRGGYPVLYDPGRDVDPQRWLEDYVTTFINQDIRQLLEVRNRSAFDRFVRLCAARTGQILNMAQLGSDCGIDGKTTAAWLGILEACYLIQLVRPYSRNFGKRLVKSPKLYFLDTGLACRLLHIADVNQVVSSPNWGALVETWCVMELVKTQLNRGTTPTLWYWRSSDGIEVDIVLELGQSLHPIEIKAAVSAQHQDLAAIEKFRTLTHRDQEVQVQPGTVIYSGEEHRPMGRDRFLPWTAISDAIPGGQ